MPKLGIDKKKIIFALCFCLAVLIFAGPLYLDFVDDRKITDSGQTGQNEFSTFLAQKEKLPLLGETVSLIAVGDISYSRGVERIVKRKDDINYPFLEIGDYLQTADLVFGNLETPITAGVEILDFSMIFRSNPGTEKALKQAGFSILSLANNHTPNFGDEGLNDTFVYLDDAGIKYAGAGANQEEANSPVYIFSKGIKFAFLAYNDDDVVPKSYEASKISAGTAFMNPQKMAKAISEAKQEADFVIVSMHSGTEYASYPNDSQINFARAAIDAGADLIIGHHPHVVQTMEEYKGKYIFYSLGNFVFDQPQSSETREAIAPKIYFTKNGIVKISILCVAMEKLAQPRPANSEESKRILQKLKFPLKDQTVYCWSEGNNDFQRETKKLIYQNIEQESGNISKSRQADLDNDLVLENYSLASGRLTIYENSKNIWQSPHDWWIDDFVLADANNDGILDINLSLWRVRNFGSSQPFWIQENDTSVKNHFFVLDIVDNSVKEIWGSSNLAVPNCEFQIADVDADGENELIAIEGDYSQTSECRGNYISVWEWDIWGFTKKWRGEKGDFSNLEIETIGGKTYILANTF